MSHVRTLVALVLVAFATHTAQAEHALGRTPAEVSGTQSDAGVLVTSSDPSNPFTLELAGETIEPLSSERLSFRIDGIEIELLVERPVPERGGPAHLEVLRRYRERVSHGQAKSILEFSFDSGQPAILWSQSDATGERRLVASTTNGGHIITITSPGVEDDASRVAYLKKTLLTLQRGQVADVGRAEQPNAFETGATLQGQLRLNEALYGEEFTALLNQALVTPLDAAIPGSIPVDPGTLRELLVLFLDAGLRAVVVSVFDGRVAHAITVQAYKAGAFEYWDPWGEGSFLQAGNNAAGVNAHAHPTKERIWLVQDEDLEKILYSVLLPFEDVLGTLRLCMLLAGPAEEAIFTYQTLHELDPNRREVSEARLDRLAQRFLSSGHTGHATTLFAAKWSAFPPGPEERQEILDALRAAGELDPNGRFRALTRDSRARPVAAAEPRTLKEVTQTDFFTFFNLEQTGEQASPSGKRLEFRSRGQFRSLVAVGLEVSEDGLIRASDVRVNASFIDDPANGMFARDFVKSFLAFAVAEADLPTIEPLLKEIWRPGRSTVPIPGAKRAGTAVPRVPSLGYMVYLGLLPRFERTLPASVLSLENVASEDGRMLTASVRPR